MLGRKLQFVASKVVIAKGLDKRGYETSSKAKKLFMALCRLLPQKPFLWLAKRGDVTGDTVHSFFAAAKEYAKNLYPRAYLTQLTEGEFAGGRYPIPADYDGCLQGIYGDYMELPPPEKRQCKQHAILVDTTRSYEVYQNYREGMTFEVLTESIR